MVKICQAIPPLFLGLSKLLLLLFLAFEEVYNNIKFVIIGCSYTTEAIIQGKLPAR